MSPALRRVALVASFVFSQVVLIAILRVPGVPSGSWLSAFRGYFSYDQLSYAAIASTAAAGTSGLPEPFTETGRSYYPSLWYRVLGWLSAFTGWPVPTVWTVAGFLVIAMSVAAVGWVGYRVSRLPWAPALVGPALAVGTLSVLVHDNWYLPLESHAVLWGPFGALYVLNAEVVALALVGVALALIARITIGPAPTTRWTVASLSVAAVLLGITANIQTYAFFVGTGVAFGWLGAYGLLRSRSRGLAVATAIIVATTLALGSVAAGLVGALPVYGLFLAGTLPGVLWLSRRHARVLVLPAVLFVTAALPQALTVISGVLADDAFLSYRQDASALLGVPLWAAVLAALPVLAIGTFTLVVALRARAVPVLAALAGLAYSGAMLTFNGLWGFGQEPYRMFIDSMAASLLLLSVLVAWAIANAHAEGWTVAARTSAGLAVALVGLSLLDVGAYRAYVRDSGMIRFDTARADALSALSAQTDGLISSGPCIDPQELKIISRKPVAWYNLGIAWPEDKAGIDGVVDSWRAGVFDADKLRAAGVRYLLTDSSCSTQWPVDSAMGFVETSSLDYADDSGSGTISLWRIG